MKQTLIIRTCVKSLGIQLMRRDLKQQLFALLGSVVSAISFAQQPLPKSLEPLIGHVIISYSPTFDSRCTTKTYEKKSSDLFGSRTTFKNNYSIYEDGTGALKYAGGGEYEAGKFVRVIFDLKPGGIGFGPVPPIFETNQELTADAKTAVQALLENALKNGGTAGFLGKPLTQGLSITPDFCQIFSMGIEQGGSGGRTVVGSAFIEGRKSLVLDGGRSFKCIPTNGIGEFNMKYNGWEAIDMQSGLPIASSVVFEEMKSSGGTVRLTSDTQCLVSGAPPKTQQPASSSTLTPKTIELRLLELKALLEKGLITQEQFEQKRTEIVKAL